MIDADALLSGPRGRRLLLAYLLASEEARFPDGNVADRPLRSAVFDAAHQLDPNPGTLFFVDQGLSRRERAATLARLEEERRAMTPAVVARRIEEVHLLPVSEPLLRESLSISVSAARYWQPPDGEDVLLADPTVRQSLQAVAQHVAANALTNWWSSPVRRNDQWIVQWIDAHLDQDETPAKQPAEAILQQWRSTVMEQETELDWPTDPATGWSGAWWSTPPSDLAQSTRRLFDGAPTNLYFTEDELGWREADVYSFLREPSATGRPVYEIDGPDAWATLCERFPLRVTAQKRHDWFFTTGQNLEWVMPDWAQVAEQYEGAHLTVSGYLTAAGLAIPVGSSASVIAGWNPDATYWFDDQGRQADSSQRWTLDDNTPELLWRTQ